MLALPSIARDLSASLRQLQWIVNTPLLAMAAMLLPAGLMVDRFGRTRTLRMGLLVFASASLTCAVAGAGSVLIAARFAQGAGAALILPAALALVRNSADDSAERARLFGLWAAWTGVASAAGPLAAGLLVDLWSWRGVFLLPVAGALGSTLLLVASPRETGGCYRPIPVRATLSIVAVLGGISYLLIEGQLPGTRGPALVLALVVAASGAMLFARDRGREVLFPQALFTARNCVAANATTFILYFGMFGLSFLVALYVQDVLAHSTLSAAAVLLPVSVMLFFAERFGRLTATLGTRTLVIAGVIAEAAGIAFIAVSPHPVPIGVLAGGAACFGLGLSLAASPLTHAAVAAAPEAHAGAASALHHAAVRASGLVAVALLGSIAAAGPGKLVSAGGVQRAMLLAAVIVAVGGLAGGWRIRDHEPGGLASAG